MIGLFFNLIFGQTYEWISFTINNSPLKSNNLSSLQISDDGILWIGSDSGLTGYNGAAWVSYNTSSDDLAGDTISSILVNDASIWLGSTNGLSFGQVNAMVDIALDAPYRVDNSELINNRIYSMNIDSLGVCWVCTDSGVTVITDTSWESLSKSSNYFLSKNTVLCINRQPTQMQYLGTENGGVSRFYYGVDGVTGASTIWKNWTAIEPDSIARIQPGLLSDTVKAIMVAKNGDPWFGTQYGVSMHIGPSHMDYYLRNAYSWRSYTTEIGMVDNKVQTLAEDSTGAIWIGTSGGVSKLIPADTTWTNFMIDSGLVSNDVRDIAIDPNGKSFWFATAGGLSKLTIMPNTIDNKKQIIPKSFEVYPAYPNPFNMSTTIKFQLTTSKQINISIYDITGRLVNSILNSSLMLGSYKVNWNGKNCEGRDISSGVYYAVVKSSDFVSTLKLVVIK